MNRLNDLLAEIADVAMKARISESEDVKRKALAEIADALASVTPAEDTASTLGLVDRPDQPEGPQGFAKFLTVADGVTLHRFHGKDDIILSKRRHREGK